MRQQDRREARKKLAQLAAQVDLRAEVRLDETIRPLPGELVTRPERVFITGSTGFLGAFLLEQLLQRGVEVHALVRARSPEAGRERLQAVLSSFGLWREAFAARLHPVLGDLGKPRLGLSEAEFAELAREVEVIYHVGAVVNLVFPYAMLKPANVLGTQEVLRLATEHRPKWLHYVSTNGFFLAPEYAGSAVPEDDPAEHTAHLGYGYLQSKWVSEQLVLLARERGVPVSLYRPTFIGWHTRTGTFNTKDFMCALIAGCVQLGVAPELDLLVEVAAVDYVASAILKLSEDASTVGKAYNVGSPHRVPWREVVALCRAQGVALREEPYDVWRALLDQSRDNPAYGFHSMLPEVGDTSGETVGDALSSGRFPGLGFAQIQRALAGTGIRAPALDAALLAPFLGALAVAHAPTSRAQREAAFVPWAPR